MQRSVINADTVTGGLVLWVEFGFDRVEQSEHGIVFLLI